MNAPSQKPHTGIVYIVGAGPGDRKLITLKGVECLQRADVVIYDLLLNDALLEHCPAHTEKIQAPDPRIRTTRQDELNRLLVEHAKAGKIVVRLKGGDPYIFGRGGEEAVALIEAGIPIRGSSGYHVCDCRICLCRYPSHPSRLCLISRFCYGAFRSITPRFKH